MTDPHPDQRIEEAAREIVKRCCPACCEHCYQTAVEVQGLYSNEYMRGYDDGKKAWMEEERERWEERAAEEGR